MIRTSQLRTALIAAGVLSASLPQLAFAQTEANAAGDTAQVQEVIVTAQKRQQAWSKVSAALSVVTADDIKSKGVTSAANLTELAPNVQIGVGAQGGMEITIRGIGNADNGERGDPQAAFHIDGIYIGRPQGAGATFFDLERVEVLRGPQGTLYGRNANAGAINLITKKPTQTLAGEVNLDLGNYRGRKVDAMLNVPLNQALALRAVVSSQQHDGYSETANASNHYHRDRDDQDNLSARLLALLQLAPNASWLVTADTSRDRDAGSAYFNITDGAIPTSRVLDPQIEGRRDNRGHGVTSEVKFGLGAADLVYLYGHRTAQRSEENSSGARPSTYNNFSNSLKQDSHELRLASAEAGPLQWVGGVYYFKEVTRNIDLDVLFPAELGGGRAIHFIQDPNTNESRAAFGQITYALTQPTRLILGLRANHDEKMRRGETRTGAADTPIGKVGNAADGAWSKRTYKLGVEHDLNATDMAYATLSTGYKAGGFNDGNAVVGDPNYNANLYYNPENIRALETGLRGRFFDNRLQLGATAFYYDYSDLQKSAVINNSLNTINAAKAAVKGLELEGRIAVSRAGRLNFALGLLSATYDRYTTPYGQDFSGNRLDRSPRATLTLGYTHSWDIGDHGRVLAYLGTHYTGAYLLSDTGDQTHAAKLFRQRASTKSDLNLTYESPDDRWSIQAYAKNLEDKSTAVAIFTNNNLNYALLSEPRTVGIRANLKF